ncbi:MAG: S8 family serine peptidase, partial [Bacteroidales bacterium]|nr:S8 family serine peptidase [Bacteroidales bacterium]
AADNGAVIAQNSWGYDDPRSYHSSDIEAINYFIAEAGRDENGNPRSGTPMTGGIVIFAAGNGRKGVNVGTDERWYPAYYDNVVAVGAVNHYGKRSYYSNYGSWVDIAAPGGDTNEKITGGIYSASYLENDVHHYEYMQGTSMACPQVSGVAALILAVYGNEQFTPEMLCARLLKSATPLNLFGSGNISGLGSGLLNAEQAVASGGTPEAVRNLTATATSHTTGSLTWATPPASDNGKAAYFAVACASTFISSDNFSQYAGAPVASSAGADAQQSYLISDLEPATTYYAAVQSIGNFGERSEISNIAVFTTLVKPPNKPDKLLVYPNPVQDVLYYVFVLDISSGETASVNIRITDTAGRTLYRISHTGLFAGTHYFETDVSNWKSGIYVLQYEQNGKTDVQKITKY